MHVRMIAMFAACMFYLHCGTTSQTLSVQYAGADAFADADAFDVVYCVRNVPVGGVGLDENNDTIPDLFLFPGACGAVSSCSAVKAAGCGYQISTSGERTLGDLPIGFRYDLRAEFRDAVGDVLYCGQQEFENSEDANSVTLTIAAGNCT